MQRGITLEDDKTLSQIAVKEGKIIVVRKISNSAALRWIGDPRAVPKPVQVKAKTLRQGPYAGLASAEDLSPEDISALEKEGFRVATPKEISALKQKGEIVGNFEHDPGIADHKLIINPDGKVLYSDVDIHGVYDLNGERMRGAPLQKCDGTTNFSKTCCSIILTTAGHFATIRVWRERITARSLM